MKYGRAYEVMNFSVIPSCIDALLFLKTYVIKIVAMIILTLVT